MASAPPIASLPSSGPFLAHALVQHGRITQEEMKTLQAAASTARLTFISQLVSSKKMSSRELATFSAKTFGLPLLDLSAIDLSQIPLDALSPKLVTRLRALPLSKRGNRLVVAISDPTAEAVLKEIGFATGLVPDPVVVEEEVLDSIIGKVGESGSQSLERLIGDDSGVEVTEDLAAPPAEATTEDVDEAPVVKYVQKILLDAINSGVSDIHFEPYEKYYRVRYRLDGILYDVAQPPLSVKEKIASRLKVVSRMDISEKRVPQDGRMKLTLSKARAIDFRVSSLPTVHGEKLCLRILDPSSATVGIEALGYEQAQQEALLRAIRKPYGMVLVTGPTGSGKTVSLYSCLNILNEPGVNISTAEDPVEINLPGVNQVGIHDRAGLTFASALKAFLRQDPDVIMVGEIRDRETGDIAIKAAQTGHMVMSTLHTNDAPSTLTRLMNMGIAPFNIASSVILVTAQRLARRLCTCKAPQDLPIEALMAAGYRADEVDGTWQPFRPVGCDACKNTGFKGRVGIYQVMPISEEMQRIIMKNGSSIDLADQAKREGIKDLRRSGLAKVRAGLTSLAEVEAVTNE